MSRNNQKLLRNPDTKIYESIDDLKKLTQDQFSRIERNSEMDMRRVSGKIQYMFLDELMNMNLREGRNSYKFLIALSVLRQDFPWLYDAGKDLLKVLKSQEKREVKRESIDGFKELIEFTFRHPMMREIYGRNRKEFMLHMQEMPYILFKYVEDLSV